MIFSKSWVYFEAVAKHGSISAASKELNVASSAISAQISLLEHEVDAPLFDRLPRGMLLTRAGEMLLHHGRKAALQVDRGLSTIEQSLEVDHGTTSLVTLEGLAQSLVADALSELWIDRPNIRVTLQSVKYEQVAEMVMNGSSELGFSYIREGYPNIRILGRAQIEIGLLVPEEHQLAQRKIVSVQDLVEMGIPLLLSDSTINVRNILEAAVGRSLLARHYRISSNSPATLTRLARLNAGVVVRTHLTSKSQSDDAGLAFLKLRELQGHSQNLVLFANSEAPLSFAGEALVDVMLSQIDDLKSLD